MKPGSAIAWIKTKLSAVPVLRGAGAYLVNGRILVFSVQRTTAGIEVHQRPVALPLPVSRSGFADAVARALAASDQTIAQPSQSEWAGMFRPFVAAAGLRSRKAFMQTAQLVQIIETDRGYLVQGWRNMGPKDGFDPDPERDVAIERDLGRLAAVVAERFRLDMIS